MQHQGQILAVAFSPDGKAVVTGSGDNTARLWDAATRESLWAPMKHQGEVVALAFGADGKAVLTASMDQTARLWDTATGQTIGAPMRYVVQHQVAVVGLLPVASVAFSPDGKAVVTGGLDGTARLWDAATGQTIGDP